MFSSDESEVLLWIPIYDGDKQKKIDEHVESILLKNVNNRWQIHHCFGIGFSPEEHKKYFKNFLSYS
ncbi:MAG: hypothetical protein APR63_12795 [Desulfuromonas sp. SDB]|nr:MAG: hypothetical protein APR63_12795 [Desulfuromonas sp. SDB]